MSLLNQAKGNEAPIVKEESSVITIQKDVYGIFNAKWMKYGREINAREKTDVQALKSIIQQIEDIIVQENAKVMEDFTQDPQLQKTAMAQADQINDLMKSKWFRADELQNAVGNKMSREAIVSALASLQAFGLIMAKVGPNGTKYKVAFTNEQRVTLIQEVQAQHLAEIERLQKEIDTLKSATVITVNDSE